MAVVVSNLRTSVLSCSERDGVVQSMTTEARITGLAAQTDHRGLWVALEAKGVPKLPSSLSDPGFEALVLTGRDADLVQGGDKDAYDVKLHWGHLLTHQELHDPFGLASTINGKQIGDKVIYGKTRCSVTQKTTNYYPNPSNPDVRQAITVAHVFPKTKKDGKQETPNIVEAGRIEQGGEIHVYVPGRNYSFEGLLDLDDDDPNPTPRGGPENLVDSMLGSVNKTMWRGKKPRTWMCTEISYQIIGRSPINRQLRRFRIGFEFQHDPDTWDTFAVFIDGRTGKPAPGLVQGVGPPVIGEPAAVGSRRVQPVIQVDYNAAFNGLFHNIRGFY